MKTTGSGGVVAQFEFELDKPQETFPAGLAGFRRGPHGLGHPGATGGRRPCRRGPKAIERSKMRAAAHQASLAAARCAVAATATALPTLERERAQGP